jgi:hypothetical protein
VDNAAAILSARVSSALNRINSLADTTILSLDRDSALADVRIVLVDTIDDQEAYTRMHVRGCMFEESAGYTCEPDWIEAADIYVTKRTKPAEIEHELLHALGLYHTCVIPSVMATEFSPTELRLCGSARHDLGLHAPLTLQRTLSPFDAAALRILMMTAMGLREFRGDSLLWMITEVK